jgi:hypothetical protein
MIMNQNLVFILAGGLLITHQGLSQSGNPRQPKVAEAYYFVPNVPSSGKRLLQQEVLAFSTATKSSLCFTAQGLFLSPRHERKQLQSGEIGKDPQVQQHTPVLHTGFVSAGKTQLAPYLRDPSPALFHFLVGEQQQWQSSITTFETLVYPQVWPGIDLEFHGGMDHLEYILKLEPGADPNQILMDAQSGTISFDGQGRLHICGEDVELILSAPRAYQTVGGETEAVEVSFARKGQGNYGFTVGTYDRSLPLTIDPILYWSSFLGGDQFERPYGVALDSTDHIYITGETYSASFPTTSGALDPNYNGGSTDAFVSKFSPQGDQLLFSTFIGGSNLDHGKALALTNDGHIVLSGYTSSANFPTTAGAYDTTVNGSDSFVLSLTGDGSQLDYSTVVGGTGSDLGQAMALDPVNGSVWLVGSTNSINFPTTAGALDPTFNGGTWDGFIVNLVNSGSQLAYGTYLGGSDIDYMRGVVLDDVQAVYVVASTRSADIPTTAAAFDPIHNGGTDAYLAKLELKGSGLQFATFLGGLESDNGYALAVDLDGHVYVAGDTQSPAFPTTAGSYDQTYNGNQDAFLVKLDPSGTNLSFSTFLGGSSLEFIRKIALNLQGETWLCGTTHSTDFPTTPLAWDASFAGSSEALLSRFNAAGNVLLYSTYLGDTGEDHAFALAVNGDGDVTLAGVTFSPLFPTTAGSLDPTHNGDGDLFVTQFIEPCRDFAGASGADWVDFFHLCHALWVAPYNKSYDINRDNRMDLLDALQFVPCLP